MCWCVKWALLGQRLAQVFMHCLSDIRIFSLLYSLAKKNGIEINIPPLPIPGYHNRPLCPFCQKDINNDSSFFGVVIARDGGGGAESVELWQRYLKWRPERVKATKMSLLFLNLFVQ